MLFIRCLRRIFAIMQYILFIYITTYFYDKYYFQFHVNII